MSSCCSWNIFKRINKRHTIQEDLLLEMDEFVTEEQQNELISYFEANLDKLAIVIDDESSKDNRQIWIQLAHQLNENGQMKSSKNWNLYFLSLLNDVKSTAINVTTHPTKPVILIPTSIENRLLTLTNPELLQNWLTAFETERQKINSSQEETSNKRKVQNVVDDLEGTYLQTLELSNKLTQTIKKVKTTNQKVAVIAPAMSKVADVLLKLAENIQEISVLLSEDN